ncbi:MAG: MFS transporter [Pseudonocardia sp.]
MGYPNSDRPVCPSRFRVGDSRKSLLTMGLATVGVGLLPGYATIGVLAPILLVVLRFVQGIGLGGEWGGAALLAAEHAPPGRRGLYTMFPQLGPTVGFLAANGVFLQLGLVLDDASFAAWGWRVPFLSSAVLVLVGLYVRVRISEPPVFARAARSRVPLVELGRHQPRELLLGSGAMIVQYALFYTATTYCLAYGTGVLGLPRTQMLLLTMIAVVALGVATAASALASDRFGRRPVVLGGCAAGVGWSLVMFPLLDTRNPVLITVALAGALAIMGLSYGPMAAYLPELFATRYRYSGASPAYSLGGVFNGAVPPLLATVLQARYGSVAIRRIPPSQLGERHHHRQPGEVRRPVLPPPVGEHRAEQPVGGRVRVDEMHHPGGLAQPALHEDHPVTDDAGQAQPERGCPDRRAGPVQPAQCHDQRERQHDDELTARRPVAVHRERDERGDEPPGRQWPEQRGPARPRGVDARSARAPRGEHCSHSRNDEQPCRLPRDEPELAVQQHPDQPQRPLGSARINADDGELTGLREVVAAGVGGPATPDDLVHGEIPTPHRGQQPGRYRDLTPPPGPPPPHRPDRGEGRRDEPVLDR